MLAPINWIKKYVDVSVDEKELADMITSTGSHVDSLDSLEPSSTNIFTGKIIEIERHPDADKLIVTKVDVKDEVLQIVTGATNVKVGDIVPVSKVGAVLADGTKIKLGKLRGIESQGMMCSYEEIGFEDKVTPKGGNDGIMILPSDMEIGLDIKDALNLRGKVLDIEITYNRPDCLCVLGMAREVAATVNEKIKEPSIEINKAEGNISEYFDSAKIDEELSKRLYLKVIKDVKIEKSPLWLQRTLMDAGMRPVNNIVDITNYVMLEFGQPLHAYDLDAFDSRTMTIERAKNNSKFKTLDDVERELDENTIIITNGSKTVGLAGIMGGLDTEITDNTRTILLESANFDSLNIRESSKRIGIRSEASSRNEKYIDFRTVELASKRVCSLIEELGAGVIVDGYINVGKEDQEKETLTFRPAKVNGLLGVDLSNAEMIDYLERLNFVCKDNVETVDLEIPYYRSDMSQEADVAEEIVRMYGVENLTAKPVISSIHKGKKSEKRLVEDKIRRIAVALGLMENMSYSFISPKAYDKACISSDSELRNYIKLLNSLGEDFSIMRTTLIPNMLESISANVKKSNSNLRFFEVGNTFIPKEIPVSELPEEKSKLVIGVTDDAQFLNLKGMVEQIYERFGIEVKFKAVSDNSIFHPGICAGIYYKNEEIGIMGEIHPDVAENYEIKSKVNIAELDVEKIIKLKKESIKVKASPKYPAVLRDIAIVVNEEILIGELMDAIYDVNPHIIESVKLFDIYQGKHIEKGFKSVAFSIVFRRSDRTMKEKEIVKLYDKVLKNLDNKFDAKLR